MTHNNSIRPGFRILKAVDKLLKKRKKDRKVIILELLPRPFSADSAQTLRGKVGNAQKAEELAAIGWSESPNR
ncbi:hypothetical protein J6590_027964 [Homalodisca vitripennis]|nr:hypothetical protein J6590_027964 [Homalodisca vitripennis]